MNLFDLPCELLELILWHCTTPSFVLFIRTCRLVRDVASGSRSLLLRHLLNIPGSLQCVDSKQAPAEVLFSFLRLSAAESLQGNSITSNRVDLQFENETIEVSACSVDRYMQTRFALVKRNSCMVHVYDFHHGRLGYAEGLDLRSARRDSQRVLLTTFDELGNLYVLHITTSEGFLETPDNPAPLEMRLTMAKTQLYSTSVYTQDITPLCQEFTSFKEDSTTFCMGPISMAAYGATTVAIAWDRRVRFQDIKQVMVMGLNLTRFPSRTWQLREDFYPEYSPEAQGSMLQSYNHSIRSITFLRTGAVIRCYSSISGFPAFGLFNDDEPQNESVIMNRLRVPCGGGLFTFQPEQPFVVFHTQVLPSATGQTLEDDNLQLCEQTHLLLALRKVDPNGPTPAYILSSRTFQSAYMCQHSKEAFNFPAHLPQDVSLEVVARLWGFRIHNSNIRPAVAYPPDGTRISISEWDKVLVWPLLPKILASGDGLKPSYNKVRDKALGIDIVEIKPIMLKADDVVHELLFIDSGRLAAITGKGVLVWDLGPNGTALRVSMPLPDCP